MFSQLNLEFVSQLFMQQSLELYMCCNANNLSVKSHFMVVSIVLVTQDFRINQKLNQYTVKTHAMSR
jgi:hypothetical protein